MDPKVEEPKVEEQEPKVEPTGEVESPATGDESGSPPESGNPPAGFQKRINELTREKYDAIRDAAYWRGVAESKGPQAADDTPTSTKAKELNPMDFNSDAEYLRAVADQAKREIRSEFEREQKAQKAEAERQRLSQYYRKGREKYEDFESVALNPSVPVTQTMFEAATGDSLHDVLYFLGNNHGEASRIAALPQTLQIKEIGKIEAKLAASPKPKGKTNAPSPPSTVSGGGGSPPPKSEKDMTRSELHAKWEADRLRRLGVSGKSGK